MKAFNNISNGESGVSVRGKLNDVFKAIISGNEGINAIWAKLNAIQQGGSRSSGFVGLIKELDYDPEYLDTNADCILIALITGTFTKLKDYRNNPISIDKKNVITVFYRAADSDYWDYDSTSITPALNGYISEAYSELNQASSGLLTINGETMAPMTLFSAVRDDNDTSKSLADILGDIKNTLRVMGSVASKANLPDDKSIGDMYLCLDENIWYFWNGNSWGTLGGGEKVNLTTTVKVGGIDANTPIANKTTSEVLTMMLCPYVAPSISAKSISDSVILYGKTYSLKVSATAKKGSNPLGTLVIDGTSYDVSSATSTVTKDKTISVTPIDNSVSKLVYNISLKDSKNNEVTSSVSTTITGGVFMFFSTQASLSSGMTLDFVANNCQTPRLSPDGSYEITHSGKEYFYIVVPTSMEVKVVRSSNVDVPMTELSSSMPMKQGSGSNLVTLNMRVYRNASEAMDAGVFKFLVNPKDN